MKAGKTVSVSFRFSQRFKTLLEAAAANDNRSLTNMLETLLFKYCEENKIDLVNDSLVKKKKSKRATE
jgi:hypothetical protein